MNGRSIENFGPNLRRLMDQRGMSYMALSKATGLPHSSLQEYVQGKHRIPLENAFIVAQYFNISLDKMLEDPYGTSKDKRVKQGSLQY